MFDCNFIIRRHLILEKNIISLLKIVGITALAYFLIFLAIGINSCVEKGLTAISAGTFSLEDYEYYIENYPVESNLNPLGSIDSYKIAEEKAELVFFEVYGEEKVKKLRPYEVSFDKKNQVWLVRGNYNKFLDNYSFALGDGLPNILIQKANGKILAVWLT